MRFGSASRCAAAISAGARAGGLARASWPVRWKQAEPGQEHPLRHRPLHRRAGGARRGGKRGEIDMRGQVGRARVGQRVGRPPAAQRLQAVAGRAVAPGRNRGTAPRRRRGASRAPEMGGERAGRFAEFRDAPSPSALSGKRERRALRAGISTNAPPATNRSAQPAPRRTNWRIGSASRNSLASSSSGAVAAGPRRASCHAASGSRAACQRAQPRRGLHQMQPQRARAKPARPCADRAQRVGHQRAAARPGLGQDHGRPARPSPARSPPPRAPSTSPNTWADLRRGGEVGERVARARSRRRWRAP